MPMGRSPVVDLRWYTFAGRVAAVCYKRLACPSWSPVHLPLTKPWACVCARATFCKTCGISFSQPAEYTSLRYRTLQPSLRSRAHSDVGDMGSGHEPMGFAVPRSLSAGPAASSAPPSRGSPTAHVLSAKAVIYLRSLAPIVRNIQSTRQDFRRL